MDFLDRFRDYNRSLARSFAPDQATRQLNRSAASAAAAAIRVHLKCKLFIYNTIQTEEYLSREILFFKAQILHKFCFIYSRARALQTLARHGREETNTNLAQAARVKFLNFWRSELFSQFYGSTRSRREYIASRLLNDDDDDDVDNRLLRERD